MPLVTVLYTVKTGFVKEKIQRDLSWYDTVKKEMKVFSGGKLEFEYKKDKYIEKMKEQERKEKGIKSSYRLLPVVKELEVVNYNKVEKKSDQDKIKKWFDDYLNYSNSKAAMTGFDESGMTIQITDEETEDFLYQLERNGFAYSI